MYRAEHPKPQFFRDKWINLNGTWKYAFDFGLSGYEREWYSNPSAINSDINVPFCPESQLSGVEYKDFIPAIWYTRNFSIPNDWDGDRVFVHFGAVDYESWVFVNGLLIGKHIGGGVSFSFDITDALKEGENLLVVYAKDSTKGGFQPLGKQSTKYDSYACLYTRTTGIWQTVWLEARGSSYIESIKITPDIDNSNFGFVPTFKNITGNMKLNVKVFAGDTVIAEKSCVASSGVSFNIDIDNVRLWCPEDPYLYDIIFELTDCGLILDTVKSYAGMRKIHIEGNKFYLNNEEIFLRFVLDQGFYPKGIWTAPSDEALKNDILMSLAAGFNGARLHQKIFEERFLYWADKLGYLVWAEYYDWGLDYNNYNSFYDHLNEWIREVNRDYNHPSIIAWTPFNETYGGASANKELHDIHVRNVVNTTRFLDPARPVNDCSGYVHVDTDIYTVHDYDQNHESFSDRYLDLTIDTRKVYDLNFNNEYIGQPFVIDEYGGTWWSLEIDEQDWGYGQKPNAIEEVYDRIHKLTSVIIDHPNIAGFCYTQLTDVELEKNGIYTYDRQIKFDMDRIKSYFQAKTKI